MISARYTDPHYPIGPLGRVAVVIPFFIPIGKTKDYGHFIEDKLETIEMNLAAHGHYHAGTPYDIILVDNGSPSEELPVMPDMPNWSGKMFPIKRENEGFGFGAWKHAWELFKRRPYDFFLFTEDDIAPTKDGWLAEILLRFMGNRDTGAVGNFVEAHGHSEVMDEVQRLMGTDRDILYCFDGGWTFTSSAILHEVDRIGGLPVFPCQPQFPRHATCNELAFQQKILELGYALDSFDETHYVIHGSEVVTGDLSSPRGPIAPLMNLNARHKIKKIRDHYAWYSKN